MGLRGSWSRRQTGYPAKAHCVRGKHRPRLQRGAVCDSRHQPALGSMSIRMRKQTKRQEIGVDKIWVPGPGHYTPRGRTDSAGADVGADTRNLQTWKSRMRNTDWHRATTDGADVMYSSLQEHRSIKTAVNRGERRYSTVMHKCLPRAPAAIDSRNAKDALKYRIFEIVAPASTSDEIGPGSYGHGRPTDVGLDKRNFQAWRSRLRTTDWCIANTDAPGGEAYLASTPFNKASKTRCGGALTHCWPLPEDEEGRPLTTAMFVPHSRPPTMKTKRPSTVS